MWQCRLIEFRAGMTPHELQTGDMFYADAEVLTALTPETDNLDWPMFLAAAYRLSDNYFAQNAHRLPLLVMLPNSNLFCVDSKCWNASGMYGGWSVNGEPPHITVSPSINIQRSYHGWIRDGIISDDCEGRVFP